MKATEIGCGLDPQSKEKVEKSATLDGPSLRIRKGNEFRTCGCGIIRTSSSRRGEKLTL
jgi:hypothetical protein